MARLICRNGSLRDLLRRKELKEKVVKFYAAQIAIALGKLHEESIIHRDVKPGNILIDDDGYLILSDFGLSKKLDKENTAMTFNIGTYVYWAPEMFNAKKQPYDKNFDWWSFGILVYELLVGKRPFSGGNKNDAQQLKKEICQGIIPFKDIDITKEAKDFITKLLHTDSKSRLGSKDDAKEVLKHPFFKGINMKDLEEKKNIDEP